LKLLHGQLNLARFTHSTASRRRRPLLLPLQFLSLLRQDLIRDLLFLWNPAQRAFHTLLSVGIDVCGHPRIVHGGFTSGAPSCLPGWLVCYSVCCSGGLAGLLACRLVWLPAGLVLCYCT
jgi:hypothetical protein